MYPTTEQAERLRAELTAWFERSGFVKGLTWRRVGAKRARGNNARQKDHYFCLLYGDSDFYSIMSGLPTAEPRHSEWLKLFGEFDAIVSKHGFWFERINNRSLNIFGLDRDGVDA